MSTTVQQLSPSVEASERRFYPRFVPKAPICIAMDGKTEGLLLNISENGLLVSTLTELPCNFVTQISVPLTGLPRPLQVNVRVIWSSEARMLAGIQLINLSEYDREQIRMWGAQTSNSLQSREGHQHSMPAQPSIETSEKIVAASALPAAIVSPAKTLPEKPPPLASLNSATTPPQRLTAFTEKPMGVLPAAMQATEEPAAKKSEWRKLKWPLIIAGLLLSGLFLLASGALVDPFSRPAENHSAGDPVVPSVLLPEQNPQASLPNTQFAKQTPVEDVTLPDDRFGSPSNKDSVRKSGLAKPPEPLAARDSSKATVTPAASAVSTAVPVPRIENAQPYTQASRNPAAPRQPEHSIVSARPNVRPSFQAATSPSAGKLTPTKIVGKPKQGPAVPVASANSPQKNKSASALSPAPAVRNKIFVGPSASKVASPVTVTASSHQPVEAKTPRNPLPSSKPAPLSSATVPDITLPPTHEPSELDTSRNTIASNGTGGSSMATAPLSASPLNAAPPVPATALPARPSIVLPRPVAAANSAPSLSPVIQMDTPGRRVVELRASGDQNSFVNIPGERTLQSSSVTMHIQRSVRLPEDRSGWLFHRDKEKKVAVGDLVSRVEPQVPVSQLAGNDSVQVRARIAPDGSVESVRPLHGEQSLVPVVLKAVRGWHFQPTLIDGKPVETQSDVLIQFHPPLSRRARQ